MRRRDFIQAIVGSSIASPFTASAQQSGRIRLIGVLINGPENDPEVQASLIAFKQELERLNWLDGGNARFDIRFTIIAGIIRDDLIATIGPLAHKSKENAREQAYVSSANGLFRCQLTRRQPNCPNSKPL